MYVFWEGDLEIYVEIWKAKRMVERRNIIETWI